MKQEQEEVTRLIVSDKTGTREAVLVQEAVRLVKEVGRDILTSLILKGLVQADVGSATNTTAAVVSGGLRPLQYNGFPVIA